MQKTPLANLVFIDIETVPSVSSYGELSQTEQTLWSHKVRFTRWSEVEPETSFEERGGIYAEFGKVVCISIGFFYYDDSGLRFRVKSFFDDNEVELLKSFSALMNEHFNSIIDYVLCGHNIREFDVPYLCRRMLINGLAIPTLLDLSGLKPWQIPHLDTMQFWKFGDYKNFTSLEHLAHLLKIPSPKSDISGKDVARVYWEEKDLERIQRYCQQDVITIAQLILKFRGKPLLSDKQIEKV